MVSEECYMRVWVKEDNPNRRRKSSLPIYIVDVDPLPSM